MHDDPQARRTYGTYDPDDPQARTSTSTETRLRRSEDDVRKVSSVPYVTYMISDKYVLWLIWKLCCESVMNEALSLEWLWVGSDANMMMTSNACPETGPSRAHNGVGIRKRQHVPQSSPLGHVWCRVHSRLYTLHTTLIQAINDGNISTQRLLMDSRGRAGSGALRGKSAYAYIACAEHGL